MSTTPGDGALPPMPRRPGRRGPSARRPPLSVDTIVAAAIALIESDGVAGLSMRAVATRLGTGPASLYAHVANKDELLELVFDELTSRVVVPTPDPDRWQDQLRQVLIDLRTELMTDSEVALAGLGRIPMSHKSLVNAEGVLAIMRAGGLPATVVGQGADLLALYVIAGVFEDSLFKRASPGPDEQEAYFAELAAFYAALPADRYPTITALGSTLMEGDGEDRFRFGLDVLIAGLVAVGDREKNSADTG